MNNYTRLHITRATRNRTYKPETTNLLALRGIEPMNLRLPTKHATFTQGLYKDRHSYGRSTMSTQLVGVFNFPILKFEEGKSAPGVAFCSKGSVFRNGGVHPSGKPSNWFIFEIIVDC